MLTAQTTIGWHMLHYGRFSLAWDQCQRKYMHHEGMAVSSHEPQWIKQVICQIFLHNYKRWRVRNDVLHKNEPIDKAEQELLLTRITALYALSDKQRAMIGWYHCSYINAIIKRVSHTTHANG